MQVEKFLQSRWFPPALFLGGCLLFGANLGKRDFWTPDEGDFAQVAREMRERGDYLLPTLNGKAYSEKPPFFYWSILGSEAVFGKPHELSARLPSVLAGAGGLALVFWLGKRLFSARAGLLAALLLGTSFEYLWRSAYLQTDMLFTFFCLASLVLLRRLLEAEEASFLRQGLPFYLALTLALLTKGLLAVALVGLTALGFLAWEKNLSSLRRLFLVRGLLLVALLSGWWYAAVSAEAGSGFLRGAFVREHLMRFFDSDSHRQPPYYYLLSFWGNGAPWSLLWPFSLWAAWKGRDDRRVRFLLVWFAATFLFLSFCSSKQGKYLLPAFPAVALLGSWWVSDRGGASGGQKGIFYTLSSLFLGIGFLSIPLSLGLPLPSWLLDPLVERHVPADLPSRLAPAFHGLAAAGLLAFLLLRRGPWAMALCLAGGAALLFLGLSFFYPDLNRLKSVRPLLERAAARMEPEARFAVCGSFRGAYAYYSGRRVTEIKSESESPLGALRALESYLEAEGPACFLVVEKDWAVLKPRLSLPVWELDRSGGSRSLVLVSNRPPGRRS